MNTKDIISSGIIESYVLGIASPEEEAMLDCMQRSFPEIKQAIADAQSSVECMATKISVRPSPGLKERIWEKITLETEESTTDNIAEDTTEDIAHRFDITSTNIPLSPSSRTLAWKPWAMAASVLLLLSLAGNFYFQKENKDKEQALVAAQAQQQVQAARLNAAESRLAMLNAPNIRVIRLKGTEQHVSEQALVFWNEDTKQVFLDAASLPKAPAGKQYQLWAMVEGKPVDAGLYASEQDIATALSTIPKAEAFAITLENEGGSPVPTLTELYVIGTVS